MTYVVGLTGGIGSGKTVVSDGFSQLGIDVIDADVIARKVVEPGTEIFEAILSYFGQSFIGSDGHLNREKLRKRIFEKENDRKWLEQRIHPVVQSIMQEKKTSSCSPYVLWVSPLLIEKKQYNEVQRILWVDAPREMRIQRVCMRDKSDRSTVKRIMDVQLTPIQCKKYVDDMIVNTGTLIELEKKIFLWHKKYLNEAKRVNDEG